MKGVNNYDANRKSRSIIYLFNLKFQYQVSLFLITIKYFLYEAFNRCSLLHFI